MELNNDCYFVILQYLDIEDALKLSSLSKHLRSIAYDGHSGNSYWKGRFKTEFGKEEFPDFKFEGAPVHMFKKAYEYYKEMRELVKELLQVRNLSLDEYLMPFD